MMQHLRLTLFNVSAFPHHERRRRGPAESACRSASACTSAPARAAPSAHARPLPNQACAPSRDAPPVPLLVHLLPVRCRRAPAFVRPGLLGSCRAPCAQSVVRGSPEVSSLSSSEPGLSSSDVSVNYGVTLLAAGPMGRRLFLAHERGTFRERRIVRQRLLHRVAHRDPPPACPGTRSRPE